MKVLSSGFKKLFQIASTEFKSVPGQNQNNDKYVTTKLKLEGF